MAVVPPKAAAGRPAVVPPKPGNAAAAVAASTKPAAPPSAAPVAATVAAPVAPPVTAGAQVTTATPSAVPAPVPTPDQAAPVVGKTEKTLYPGTVAFDDAGSVVYDESKDDAGNPVMVERRVKLTEVPTDYNPQLHVRLTKHDFATKRVFFLFMAAESERMAAVYRAKAEGIKVESPEKQAKRREKLLAQLRSLAALMGTTPEALLKQQEAPATPEAAGATAEAPAA